MARLARAEAQVEVLAVPYSGELKIQDRAAHSVDIYPVEVLALEAVVAVL